jgi:hypothetical protein
MGGFVHGAEVSTVGTNALRFSETSARYTITCVDVQRGRRLANPQRWKKFRIVMQKVLARTIENGP